MEIKNIMDKFWFGAVVFAAAGTVLWIMGHQWWAGTMYGAAASKLVSSVKNIKVN